MKQNALMAKVPEAALRIDAGEQFFAMYEWNSLRAKRHFCARCGIYLFHRKRAAPDYFGLNVFGLDAFDVTSLPVHATEGVGMTLPREEWPGPRASEKNR